MSDLVKCPACRSTSVMVIEIHEEIGTTDPGPVRVINGALYPIGPFYFEAAHSAPQVELRCGDCEHHWHPRPRKPVGGVLDATKEAPK